MILWILSFLVLALLLLFIDYRKLAALKKLVLPFFIVLCLSCLILTIILIYAHLRYKNEIIQSTKSSLISLTVEARKGIERILQETMDAAESIADDVTSGKLKDDEILDRLKTTAEQNKNFYGINIAYKPYAYSPDRKLYSPYFGKKGGVLTFSQLDKIYDYTKPEYEWYTLAMEKGPRWCEPYFGEAGLTLISTYSALFYETDTAAQRKDPIGVVTIDISLDQIGKIIRSLDLGPSGFGALLSQKGRYLYHPNNEYVLSGKTILELGEELNDADRL
ncbi:MAG: hypothetical protein JSV84_09265 [Gemmatimonadota bacterium]|nr:MAG: hypothetical protein JSV84_09265 [Gemmatimonadota bacterium]